MNKKLIQELLNDDETRGVIAALLRIGDGPMRGTLNKLNDTLNKLNDEPAKGEMITIEVSSHIWVRGEYVRTLDDGRMVVDVPELTILRPIHGKRIKMERSEMSE